MKYVLLALLLPTLAFGTITKSSVGYTIGGDPFNNGTPYDLTDVYYGLVVPVPNDSTTIVVDSFSVAIAYGAYSGSSPSPNQTVYMCDSAAGTLLATATQTTTYEIDQEIYDWLEFGGGSIYTATDTTKKFAVGVRSQAVGGSNFSACYGTDLNGASGWTKFSRGSGTAPTSLGTVTYDANDAIALIIYYHYGVAPPTKSRRRRMIGIAPQPGDYHLGVIFTHAILQHK